MRHAPGGTVQVGRHRHHVSAYFLNPEEGAEVMAGTPPGTRAQPASCAVTSACPRTAPPTHTVPPAARSPFVRLVAFPGS